MKSLHPHQLKEMLDRNDDIQIIDVREPFEYEICHLHAELIPVGKVLDNIEKINTSKPVIVYCHHGIRSARVIAMLEEQFQLENLYNLRGGIHAWAEEIDSQMATY